MRRRTLGPTGLVVSTYSLGTMTFGQETPERDAFAILDAYVEAGGSMLDVADVYAGGESERIVGRWLADRGLRDQLVVATKARFPVAGAGPLEPNRQGLSRAYLTRAIDASLSRLDVDHIDLYQVHGWDPLAPVEEWLTTMDDLVRAGKVRYVGVSNLTGWQLQRAALTARHLGLAPIVSLQPQYNLLVREIEWELVPACAAEDIGLLPWSPLGGGWLTGKYGRDERPSGATRLGEDPDRGVEAYDKRNTERTFRIIDAVVELADAHGATPSQIALAWVTAQPQVDSTILGVRTLGQLQDNLGAAEVELEDVELQRLDEVSAPPTPDYPYALIEDMTADRRDLLR